METLTENKVEQVELSKEEQPGAHSGAEAEIISQFDEILGRHLDALLGSRQGIDGLLLNIFTISSLILLATRETEIQTFPYLPPERYTNQTILDSIEEMNIESGGDLGSHIKSMLEKGYVNISDDGRFFPGPPTMKMASLFDKLFPKMPGLNLVAYLGQMIDEVFSNRKSLNVALNQFDQMLNLHGVSLKKDGEASQNDTGKLFPHLKIASSAQPATRKVISTNIKPSDIFSQLQTKAWKAPPVKAETVVTSSGIRNGDIEKDESGGLPENEAAGIPPVCGIETEATEQGLDPGGAQETGTSTGRTITAQSNEVMQPAHLPWLDKSESIYKDNRQNAVSYDRTEQPEDDDIEERIAAFEEQLGMACPLCRTAGILPRVTAKGKQYYKCSNDGCNFISWGKPYYITCPRCENPFLIEAPDSQGNMMLKCPRATCPHWQKFPWEKDDESDKKSIEPDQSSEVSKKPRKVLKRKRRVVVRRKS
jgi:hypothetical protein